MKRFLTTLTVAAGALVCLALFLMPVPTCGQTSYIPRPPEPDTILGGKPFIDPRVAPRDAWNPHSKDPRVPRNDDRIWNHRDYYAISGDPFSIYILPIVENGHLGLKTNPRGFWKEYNLGRWTNAVGELKYVLNVFPNHPRALYLMTRLADLLHDPGLPIAYFEKALRMYPDRPETRVQYGAYLVQKGETMLGLAQLDQALAANPNLITAIAWRTRARQELGFAVEGDSLKAPVYAPESLNPDLKVTQPAYR
jgi:tetratricopeptide (TPR) repeat protein